MSESLKTLVEAHRVTSSTKDNASVDAVTSSSVKEQTAALCEQHPPSPEDAESETGADDVMVQIRARKSEVSLCQQIRQLFWQEHFLVPSLVSVKQMNNHK